MNGKVRAKPFLDIRKLVSCGGERGLLSVAFSPKYRTNHKFYVDYTDVNGDTRVIEYRSNGRFADGATAAASLRQAAVPEPQRRPAPVRARRAALRRHGRRRLGRRSPGQRAGSVEPARQAPDDRREREDAAAVAIAGYGLRNPWRFSFDAAGNLYIGDVGQDSWEEIDYTPRSSPGLENYGWNVYEGSTRSRTKEPLRAAIS